MAAKRSLTQALGDSEQRASALSDGKAGHHEAAGESDEADELPSDIEAAILLLRAQLYPDPAVAAAAAAQAKRSRHAKRAASAPGPSKAAAAAATAAAAAAAARQQLPGCITKSQLYTVLSDRTEADRELEALRRAGRVRLFRLAIGADEHVLLLAADYEQLIKRAIAKHEAQQQQQQQDPGPQHHQQPDPGQQQQQAAAIAAALRQFRERVLPAWHEPHISEQQLRALLQPGAPAATPSAGAAGPPSHQQRHQQQQRSQQQARARAAQQAEALLLAAEVICRDARSPGAYVLTVPGAAGFVRSLQAGRSELLALLGRKRYQEAPERELACAKLRGCSLTAAFLLRDLQGRGLVRVADSAAGRVVRLVAAATRK